MDEPLRSLERRFKATAEPEAEREWLAARLRAGTLAPEDLELAAALGHAGAAQILGVECAAPASWESIWAPGLAKWANEISRRGSTVVRRAALACCRSLPVEDNYWRPEFDRFTAALERLVTSGEAPPVSLLEPVAPSFVMETTDYSVLLMGEVIRAVGRGGGEARTHCPQWVAWDDLVAPFARACEQPLECCAWTLLASWLAFADPEPACLVAVFGYAARASSGAEVPFLAVRNEVCPWLLG